MSMSSGHIGDESLELYSSDQLAEDNAASVEEHLLICDECRVRLKG